MSQQSSDLQDEVFKRYGAAMFRAQCLEQEVENLIWAELKATGAGSRLDRQEVEKQTLGGLWRRVEGKFSEIDPVWASSLKTFIRYRNYMAHHLFVDAAEAMADAELFQSVLDYVDGFEKACGVASYHLHLLAEAAELTIAKRFSGRLEEAMAQKSGITPDTEIRFRRFKPNA